MTDDLDKSVVERMPEVLADVRDGGVSFERAYVSDPLCCPSRASTLTGLYVEHHGVKSNHPETGGAVRFRERGMEDRTFAVALEDAGYRTALIGKYLNHTNKKVPPGWSEWDAWYGDPGATIRALNTGAEGVASSKRACNPENCHDTDLLGSRAVEFIEETPEGQPFMLYLSVSAPHDPDLKYVAPRYRDELPNFRAERSPAFDERDLSDKPAWVRENSVEKSRDFTSSLDRVQRNRAKQMLSVREAYQNLIRTLQKSGELDETYIFFTSDNGVFAGQHGLGVGKTSPYLHDIEIPLYVRGPGIEPGSKDARLVSNIDLYPTFLELAGVRSDTGSVDGRSFAPLLLRRDVPWRKRLFVEGYFEATRSTPYPIPDYTTVVENRLTYTLYGTGEEELYDLRRDPYQLENSAGAAPKRTDRLERLVEGFEQCRIGECRKLENRP